MDADGILKVGDGLVAFGWLWVHHECLFKGSFMKKKLMLLALFVGIAAFSLVRGRTLPAQPAPRRIEVVAKRYAFSPENIVLKKGEPVILVLKSVDVAHGIRFRELNLDLKVGKGGTAEVQFTPEQTGDYVGHCSVFCGSGHGSMTLTLHVVD
jgi:cytochrome c oxidase subunit 2